MGQAIKAYSSTSRGDWVKNWPGQVVLAASIVHWTSEVTASIRVQGGLDLYCKKCNRQIDEIVNMVRGQLSSMTRISLEALIVIDVHGKIL